MLYEFYAHNPQNVSERKLLTAIGTAPLENSQEIQSFSNDLQQTWRENANRIPSGWEPLLLEGFVGDLKISEIKVNV